MLEKIEKQEIMTTRAAKEKYETKYFLMVITEIIDRADNDLGYVIYTADDKREYSKVPMNKFKGKRVASMQGIDAEPFPSFGGLEIVCYDSL